VRAAYLDRTAMGLPGMSTGLALLLFVVEARRPLPDLYENMESFSISFSI